ncbi:MAG: aminoglycoside phosphotransferase family protein [Microcella sp.]|nr:aminoglycoside phosphotransferase family protein [Microcella sp.]
MSIAADALTADARARLASDAEVLDRVHRTLGPVEVVDEHWGADRSSRVLHVMTRGGEQAVVKWHRDAGPHQRESTALQQYAIALGSDAPRLVLSDAALRLTVLSRLLGEAAVGTRHERDGDIHHRAGDLLRRLHDAEPPRRHALFGPSIAAEFERWSVAAERLWGDGSDPGDARGQRLADERARARECIVAAMDLGEFDHVPVHGRFEPRHWIIDPGGRVRLIDFSTVRFEPRVTDLLWLEYGPWRDEPWLRAAFLHGYGRIPTDRDDLALRAMAATRGLELLVRGHGRGHTAERALGRGMLDRLLGATLF